MRGTWAAVGDAVTWLAGRYREHLPEGDGWVPLAERGRIAGEQLAGGVDVVWSCWVSDTWWSGQYVIVCPNRFWPGLPCPAERAGRP
ncbi:hypothetical protein GCM10009639_42030 [Kitasatospora putterlickiae]|uniref:Uncharacterized protein n=1 Tax=Kitasatospora putterlickiae TaxID=221725 RepID=A0ABN1Y8B3_9ACTN